MNKAKTTLAITLLSLSGTASAGLVTNDTELLSAAGHQQLSAWLGEDVDLTRIFAKGVDGNTGEAWHSKVDNQGRTFTVLEIFNGEARRIVGGYNEFNWTSSGNYVRTASVNNFLFNLTDGLLFQKNGSNDLQTYNRHSDGPTFGAGHDLHVSPNLTTGYANIGYSYGDRSQFQQTAYRESFAGSYNSWNVGRMETFTLHNSTGAFGSGAQATTNEQGNAVAADVSTPLGLGAFGLLLLGAGARLRAQA